MAINENGYLRGQIGYLVHRKVGNQNIVQTRAGGVRQTRWTKAAANDFGRASTAGALVRRAFIDAHQRLHDNKMHNRLVRQMQRVMSGNGKQYLGEATIGQGNLQRIVNFQFNDHCHLHDYVFFDPVMEMDEKNHRLSVHLPAVIADRHIRIPLRCSHIVLKINIVAFDFLAEESQEIGTEELEVKLYSNETAEEQTFDFDIGEDGFDTVLVAMSVLYIYKESKRVYLYNHEQLHPAGIIGAFHRPRKDII